MKKNKIILGLSCLAILTVCTLNVQNSLNTSNELGYNSLMDLITLNSASAEEGGSGCSGTTCDAANGYEYGAFIVNNKTTCCGSYSSSPGNKSS